MRWRFVFAALAVCAFSAMGAEDQAVRLGRLEPFWRYSAVLGPVLERGHGLVEIPDYMTRGDLAYRKKSFAKEVPFADHLSVVRLLGGYSDGKGVTNAALFARDLAFRGADGKIGYRMELLRERLKPYVDCGYTNFTLVLDDIPWCFPEKPSLGSYGQCVPPHDEKEWHDFIKVLCEELKKILGPEAANGLRFRAGTERNGRQRFNGSQEEFFRHYEAGAMAVREVLPGAKFGVFNISGISVAGVGRFNVNAYALAEFCDAKKLPFDWVAFSRYYRPGTDPDEYARVCRDVWDEFGRRLPSLKSVSREIHEFGFAPWGEVEKGVFASTEPGANGAALTSQIMWRLREAGINRLWHWGVTDNFRDRKNKLQSLFTGKAWLLCAMERMAGGDAFLLPVIEPQKGKSKFLAAASVRDGAALVMISAYNTDCTVHAKESVSFRLPSEVLKLNCVAARCVAFTEETSVYDRIRRDLEAKGLLSAEYKSHPGRVGDVREMGEGRDAERFVGDRLADYEKQWSDLLALKPLAPEIASVACDEKGTTIIANLTTPEVLVLELKSAEAK